MAASDGVAGGFDGAAGTLAAALTAPADELAAAADRDVRDILAFEDQHYNFGDPEYLWPHPENYDPHGPLRKANAALMDETTL